MAHPSLETARLRVLAHVDLDAFYTQVEVQRDPALRGKPVVVVQYNPFGDLSTVRPEDTRVFPDSNGSIIAVSYEARASGVKRNMMAQQAKAACPDLVIVQVPVAHGKADLTIYRDAGAKVMSILSRLAVCERASIDEAYLDLTQEAGRRLAGPGGPVAALGCAPDMQGWHLAGSEGEQALGEWWARTAAAGSPEEQLLAAGAAVVAELRQAVHQELQYSCSAGISHYKILAKLGSGLHKPGQQTLVPASQVPPLLGPLPIPKLRQLGGKFGEQIMSSLGIATVGELAAVPLPRLEAAVGEESAAWLHRLAHGIDDEEVKQRLLPKSCSCGKTFRGNKALDSLQAVERWLLELGGELQERLDADRAANQRLPQLLTVTVDAVPHNQQQQPHKGQPGASSRASSAAIAPSKQHATHTSSRSASSASSEQRGSPEPASPTPAGGSPNTAPVTTSGRPGGGSERLQPGAGPGGWRAGVQTSSRSCPLGRPTASSMAATALGMVKRWAADRPPGWRIVSLFLFASNFTPAPTGSSTLERFLKPKPLMRQQEQQQQQQQTEGSSGQQAPPLSLLESAQQPHGVGGGELEAVQQQHAALVATGHGGSTPPGSSRKRKRQGEHQALLQAYLPAAGEQAASSGQPRAPESAAAGGQQQLPEEQQQANWAPALPPSVGGAMTTTGTASTAPPAFASAIPPVEPWSGSGQLQELPASLQVWLEQPSAAEHPAAAGGGQQQHLGAQQQDLRASAGASAGADADDELGWEQTGAAAEEGVVLQPHPAVASNAQLERRPALPELLDPAAAHAGGNGAALRAAGAQHHAAAAAGTREAHTVLQLADLDAAVLAELPYHIQLEIKRELGLAPPAGATGAAAGSAHGHRGAAAAGGGRGVGGGRQQRRGRGAGPARGRGQDTGSIKAFFASPGDT